MDYIVRVQHHSVCIMHCNMVFLSMELVQSKHSDWGDIQCMRESVCCMCIDYGPMQCICVVVVVLLLLQHKQEEADEVKRKFAEETRSDHIALLRAFEVYTVLTTTIVHTTLTKYQ